MNIRKSQIAVFVLAAFSLQASAETATTLKWAKSVEEILKPIDVEVDSSNADVGAVFVYVTYQMVKPCRNLSIYSRSVSAEGVILNEAYAVHANVSAGAKYRDMFLATYKRGHSVVLHKANCQ